MPIYLPGPSNRDVTWEAHKRSGESVCYPRMGEPGALRRTRRRMASFPATAEQVLAAERCTVLTVRNKLREKQTERRSRREMRQSGRQQQT